MTATFINGTQIADAVRREAGGEVAELNARGILPGLAVVLVGDNAASSAYVNMKAKTLTRRLEFVSPMKLPIASAGAAND